MRVTRPKVFLCHPCRNVARNDFVSERSFLEILDASCVSRGQATGVDGKPKGGQPPPKAEPKAKRLPVNKAKAKAKANTTAVAAETEPDTAAPEAKAKAEAAPKPKAAPKIPKANNAPKPKDSADAELQPKKRPASASASTPKFKRVPPRVIEGSSKIYLLANIVAKSHPAK